MRAPSHPSQPIERTTAPGRSGRDLDAHDHRHGGGDAVAGHAGTAGLYAVAIVLTAGYALVELIGGRWTGSLALMSDGGHMFFDAAALTLAAVASRIALRPATARHSFGLARAEVIGAALNGLFMLLVIALIVHEAVLRLADPRPIAADWAIAIALVGLAVNLLVAGLLSRAERTLNTRAALLHVVGDLLGSVAAITAGIAVYFTGWNAADAWLALVIAALILVSTLRLLGHTLHVLLEGVPAWIDLTDVRAALIELPGVADVTQLRVWTVGSGHAALTAHLRLDDPQAWGRVLPQATMLLNERFSIGTVTLQPEAEPGHACAPDKSQHARG
jgi:cobalt-zinc-cadmium efflux system protein